MEDRIEKRFELQAPVARVWRALTDYQEFGEWFRVKLDGPFVPGQVSHGRITCPGFEHLMFEMTVERMEADGSLCFPLASLRRRPGIRLFEEPATWSISELQAVAATPASPSSSPVSTAYPASRRAEAFLGKQRRLGRSRWSDRERGVEG